MPSNYCGTCGSFHELTTAGCTKPFVGSVTFGPARTTGPFVNIDGEKFRADPGSPPLDTGTIHRAPLLAKIEELERDNAALHVALRHALAAMQPTSGEDRTEALSQDSCWTHREFANGWHAGWLAREDAMREARALLGEAG